MYNFVIKMQNKNGETVYTKSNRANTVSELRKLAELFLPLSDYKKIKDLKNYEFIINIPQIHHTDSEGITINYYVFKLKGKRNETDNVQSRS